jgi:hypothetical protein
MAASIDGLRVTFTKIIKKHESGKTNRIHYKVQAEVKTAAGKERQEYWFAQRKSFLRQKDLATGKTSIKVGCNRKQRERIRELVKSFDAAASEASAAR